ncbi:putative HTH tetR-type domain-containing protein [Frankia sp. Hr75.2]|nr:putative HTH tetR-type domain-containing protein [Frankia sp. Hr75.2]
MLDAGEELLVEWLHSASAGGLLSNIKATDIARRVGKTTGSFFHWWPTQEAYREQLLEHLLSADRMRELNVEGTLAAITEAVATRGRAELSDVIRAGGRANFEDLGRGNAFEIQILLLAGRAGDPQISTALKAFYRALLDAFVPVYIDFLNLFQRRMRAPFTVENYAVALTALAEGLHMRRLVDPDMVPDSMPRPPGALTSPESHDEEWSLFASVMYALTEAMTEPDPEAVNTDDQPEGPA